MFNSSRSPLRRAGPATVIARMGALAPLGAADHEVLAGLGDWRWDPPGIELLRDTGHPGPRVVVSGWAARVRNLDDGRRQIISLILPGDGIGICRKPKPLFHCPVMALTPVQTLDATPILRAIADQTTHAALCRSVDLAAAFEEAWLMDQIVRLGRLTAYERLAHLIMEIRFRLSFLDMEPGGLLPFPLTQEMLADATGLSMVHVNRTLQQLRKEKLIEVGQGRLRVVDAEALGAVADFREPASDCWELQRPTPMPARLSPPD